MNKEMGFVTAMLDFFGKLPGQTTGEFSKELKALDDDDRDYFRKALEGRGYKLTS